MPTRIVLADDHALVRQGFRALLAAIADFEVVGEAAGGRGFAPDRRRAEHAPDCGSAQPFGENRNGLRATAHRPPAARASDGTPLREIG